MTESRIFSILAALCAATFLVTSSGPALAPFLQAIARDVDSDLGAIANLFSLQAITWGSASLAAGALSDRLGRRPILIVSVLLLGACRLGFATSNSYAIALTWQLISGVAGGAFMGTVFAAVSDHVPPLLRGRALGWVVTGQSLSLVLGVPLITLLGSFGGWRGAIATHGAITIGIALAVRRLVPADPPSHLSTTRAHTPFSVLAKPRILALLAAGTTERLCFAVIAIYLATYLQQSYGVTLAQLAFALALVALGNLLGNVVGGRIADRYRSRSVIFAVASAATAVLAIPLMAWQPGLGISISLGFVYSFANALGRPAFLATLSEVPNEVRGAAFGINVTMASVGWLLAASIGSWFVTHSSFDRLGGFCALAATIGTALAVIYAYTGRYAKGCD